MGNILTLEDFNTLLGLYAATTTEYIMDFDNNTDEGQYDFLNVTTEDNNFIVEVVNSLFTGTYTVISGENVSYADNIFTFPINQTTTIKILLGANNSSKIEFNKFVTRPCYEDYVCDLIAKNADGTILANKSVAIGSYTGTTNNAGEVSITIPANRADVYQYPIIIDNVEMDSLEFLRTKVYLNPVCITEYLYIESYNTLSFDIGLIGHSVECKCKIQGYTYTASSDSATGIVSFTINPIYNEEDFSGADIPVSSINYEFKALNDDWIYEANFSGTISLGYYVANNWNSIVTAYNNDIKVIKVSGTITANSTLTITKDFIMYGESNNILEGNGGFEISGDGYLELNDINITDINDENTINVSVIGDNSKITLNRCNVSEKENTLFDLQKGWIECWNSTFTDCAAPIFKAITLNKNKGIFLQECNFNVYDFDKTSHDKPLIIDNNNNITLKYPLDLRLDLCNFDINVFGVDNDGEGSRLSLFAFNRDSKVNYELSSFLGTTLTNSENYGQYYCEITTNGILTRITGSGKAFKWIQENSNTRYKSINITEEVIQ